ncbi:ankyrin repeat-containing domain protein [Aspergillus karnatakaensis]|uniref:ankyrin repeat-containing domain protein n=1 Tax=Aspergillus karnatakaensis TaxID=1810916 RepID=UPI003CCD3895
MASNSPLRCSRGSQNSRLLSLPDELILIIGEELALPSLNALILSSKRFYFTLNASLYTLMLERSQPHKAYRAVSFAAQVGNLAALKKIFTYVAPEEYWLESNWFYPFLQATRGGHHHVLRYFFEIGAPWRTRDLDQMMLIAAKNNHVKVVEAFLDGGLDITDPGDLKYCPLVTAALGYQGDLATVKLLCGRGARIDMKSEADDTVLHELAKIGSFDMLQFFLDLGSPVDAQNIEGDTPLFNAVRHQHHSAVLLLLSRGANVSILNSGGNTALHIAVLSRAASAATIVQLLLDHGADVNARSGTDKTPLHLSTRGDGGDQGIVKVLLAAGADCRAIVDKHDGTTPLLNAMASGYFRHPNISLLLEAGGAESPGQDTRAMITWAVYHNLADLLSKLVDVSLDPDLPDFLATWPLIEAVHPGRERILGFLLGKVTDVNWKAPHGTTALMQAATKGASLETVKLLLERGAHADAKDRFGGTALMYAARSSSPEVTEMILARTAQPDAVDTPRQNALHYAIDGQQAVTVDVLLKHGISPTQEARSGISPMALAIRRGNPLIVRSLLNYQVGVETRDREGDTPLTAACKQGETSIAQVLLEAGASPETQAENGTKTYPHSRSPLCIACETGNYNLASLLLSAGANPEASTEVGQKPLGIASAKSNTDIVALLLDHGARADTIVSNIRLHRTALINAAQYGQVKTVELLLARGACINSPDYYGRTALSHAAGSAHIQPIQVLIDAGAEIDSPDCKGQTPLSWAVVQGHAHAAEILVRAGADVTRPDKEGCTPITLALRATDEAAIKVLYQTHSHS